LLYLPNGFDVIIFLFQLKLFLLPLNMLFFFCVDILSVYIYIRTLWENMILDVIS